MSEQSGGRAVPREPIQMVADKTGASQNAGTITLTFRKSAGGVVSVPVEQAEPENLASMLQRALEAARGG
jgi:hypothetical protein